MTTILFSVKHPRAWSGGEAESILFICAGRWEGRMGRYYCESARREAADGDRGASRCAAEGWGRRHPGEQIQSHRVG